jgi:hypothetical protein
MELEELGSGNMNHSFGLHMSFLSSFRRPRSPQRPALLDGEEHSETDLRFLLQVTEVTGGGALFDLKVQQLFRASGRVEVCWLCGSLVHQYSGH